MLYSLSIPTLLALSSFLGAQASIPYTNDLKDDKNAYKEPWAWASVKNMTLKTFDTEEYTFDDMYNDPKPLPKIKIGMCLNADDYPDSLEEPCGLINVRGSSSRGAKMKSLKLKLDKKAPLGKWQGRRHILLIKSAYDYSRIRNAVAYEMYSRVNGQIGISVGFVHLYMNGDDYGLYHVVERLDDDYLANHGAGKSDYYLKADSFAWQPPPEDFVPNIDQDKPNEWLDARNAPKGDDGEFTDDWYYEMKDLTEELDTIYRNEECETAAAFFNEHIDMESLVQTLAINAILLDSDAVNHNFNLYKAENGDKWSHTVWDRDGSLDYHRQARQVDDFYERNDAKRTYAKGILYQYTFETWNILYRVFFRAEGNLDRVLQKAEELTSSDGPLSGSKFTETIQKYADAVEDYVTYGWANTITKEQHRAEIDRLLDVYSDPLGLMYSFETELDAIRELGIPMDSSPGTSAENLLLVEDLSLIGGTSIPGSIGASQSTLILIP